ncbi:MAG: hypothetical protein ACK5LO_15570 [Leucobacter sp.]
MTTPRTERIPVLVPTLTKQSWLFMIGSALFALSVAPGMSHFINTQGANLLCFVGAWFFTAAGLQQWILSGAATLPVKYQPGKMFRAEWLAAGVQSVGTILFNVSTTGALSATTVHDEKHLVWNPDAGGSVAFLISAVFVLIAYDHANKAWSPSKPGWWSAWINMIGCVAFGFSAVGSFIQPDGSAADSDMANWGTFIGAICFFMASLIALPKQPWNRAATAEAEKKFQESLKEGTPAHVSQHGEGAHGKPTHAPEHGAWKHGT